ncbi:hypothetical protein NL676_001322 [Syzygium grande]|nr:hypothetical protein NL676_001322 [Syzygium grande]
MRRGAALAVSNKGNPRPASAARRASSTPEALLGKVQKGLPLVTRKKLSTTARNSRRRPAESSSSRRRRRRRRIGVLEAHLFDLSPFRRRVSGRHFLAPAPRRSRLKKKSVRSVSV